MVTCRLVSSSAMGRLYCHQVGPLPVLSPPCTLGRWRGEADTLCWSSWHQRTGDMELERCLFLFSLWHFKNIYWPFVSPLLRWELFSSLAHLLIGSFSFHFLILVFSFCSSLWVLCISVCVFCVVKFLPEPQVATIFSYSAGCLLTVLIKVYFVVQDHFSFMEPHFLMLRAVFFFLCCWGSSVIMGLCWEEFCLYCVLGVFP